MKKNRLFFALLVVLVMLCGQTFAKKVPQDKAIQVAAGFFKKAGGFQQQMCVLRTSEDIPSLGTKASSDPKFYIIGSRTGKGFVIVSADDRFTPILGYSLDNAFAEGDIPESMAAWFKFLGDQMEWAESNGIVDNSVAAQWSAAVPGNPVKTLETAQWNQGAPYNYQCPMQGSDQCVTGCVPTALCEVMRYHRFPSTGIGTTSAYTGSYGVSVESRDLSSHTYDWDNMPLTISEYTTQAQCNAVATLMADVGAAIQASYSAKATSAFANTTALVSNFGFSAAASFDYRKNYNDEKWSSMLRKEIDEDRPVVYNGYDDFNGGHCFLIDGYDDKGLFRFNWGWGGYGNGYFGLSALNVSGCCFNNNQNAIFGLKPGNGQSEKPEKLLNLVAPGLTSSQTSFEKGGTVLINDIRMMNASLLPFSGYAGIFLTDKRETFKEGLAAIQLPSFPAGTSTFFTGAGNVTLPKGVEILPGYRIRIYYSTDFNTWIPMYREDIGDEISQEILLAEDVDPLQYRCKVKMTSKKVIVTMPEGATAGLYKGDTPVEDGVETDGTSISALISKLERGVKYTFRVEMGKETKNMDFVLKKKE